MSDSIPELAGHLEIRIRDLEAMFFVGVRDSEKARRQRLRINVWLYVPEIGRHQSDDLADTVSYSEVVAGIGRLAASERHTDLIETLAERVAELALADPRVARVVVGIEKPDIYPHVASVGVRIERRQSDAAGSG
jgi:7,8-dihydroneopterin aldolase/epimerase/oxygenase